MKRIVITGHGHFASGLLSGFEMVAGNQPDYYAVEFLDGMDPQDLMDTFSSHYTAAPTLVLADLCGGSPFQMAVMAGRPFEHCEVLGGVNQGMLLESLAHPDLDVHELALVLEEAGKACIRRFPK